MKLPIEPGARVALWSLRLFRRSSTFVVSAVEQVAGWAGVSFRYQLRTVDGRSRFWADDRRFLVVAAEEVRS
jgi:hypothetical protein